VCATSWIGIRRSPARRQAFQVGYDPALADPTGRFFYASVRYRFR
jgi:hypothetical protein